MSNEKLNNANIKVFTILMKIIQVKNWKLYKTNKELFNMNTMLFNTNEK